MEMDLGEWWWQGVSKALANMQTLIHQFNDRGMGTGLGQTARHKVIISEKVK